MIEHPARRTLTLLVGTMIAASLSACAPASGDSTPAAHPTTAASTPRATQVPTPPPTTPVTTPTPIPDCGSAFEITGEGTVYITYVALGARRQIESTAPVSVPIGDGSCLDSEDYFAVAVQADRPSTIGCALILNAARVDEVPAQAGTSYVECHN